MVQVSSASHNDMRTTPETMPELLKPAEEQASGDIGCYKGQTDPHRDVRESPRHVVPPLHRLCELTVQDKVLPASLIEESNGGFAVLIDHLGGLKVGDKVRFRTKAGWFMVRIVYINSINCLDCPNHEDDSRFRVGLAKEPLLRNDGDDFLCKGDFDSAISAYTEAIQLDPTDVKAYFGRGLAYWHKNDLSKSIADYSEAIRLNPTQAAAYCSRASAYLSEGEYEEAIADCIEAIHLDPENAGAYHEIGRAYGTKGDFDKAIAAFTEAIRLNPQLVEAYYGRVCAWGRKCAFDKSIADLTQIIQLRPQDAQARYLRGLMHAKAGENTKADEDLAKARELEYDGP
jgi:Flp pilus assembly protein TadD